MCVFVHVHCAVFSLMCVCVLHSFFALLFPFCLQELLKMLRLTDPKTYQNQLAPASNYRCVRQIFHHCMYMYMCSVCARLVVLEFDNLLVVACHFSM